MAVVETHKGMLREEANGGRFDCHIALLPSFGLGDSLIYLITSHGLVRAGFHFTTFRKHLIHFSGWLPDVRRLLAPRQGHGPVPSGACDITSSDFGGAIANLNQDTQSFVSVSGHRGTGYIRFQQYYGVGYPSAWSAVELGVSMGERAKNPRMFGYCVKRIGRGLKRQSEVEV